jgi:S1-C subfamily serine protease
MRFLLAAAILILAGCRSTPIESLATSAVPIGRSSDQIAAVIQSSLTVNGWRIIGQGPNEISADMGTVSTTVWVIRIRIRYDTSHYEIAYVDSVNMDYDAARGVIHENYNRRIENLKQSINRGLAGLPPMTSVSTPTTIEPPTSRTPPGLNVFSTGTGFFITGDGYLITNAHVADGCSSIETQHGERLALKAIDRESDLALLKQAGVIGQAHVKLRSGRGIRLADEVIALGFPFGGQVSSDMNVTIGNVSALAGIGNDRRYFQLTAPLQPGNSGGPILDHDGNLVGVVVYKLATGFGLKNFGDIPQNVNFGVSLGTVQAFLDAEGIAYELGSAAAGRDNADIASEGHAYTQFLACYK